MKNKMVLHIVVITAFVFQPIKDMRTKAVALFGCPRVSGLMSPAKSNERSWTIAIGPGNNIVGTPEYEVEIEKRHEMRRYAEGRGLFFKEISFTV